ncbi:hypothetical protein DINM_000412 [Dirofilaria immitis]|nr:hypothetical protein [Dirofilaria immitis]
MKWSIIYCYVLVFYVFQALAQYPQHQTLQCGATTFNKLSFDPPIRSNPLPIGRLVYVPLDQIVNGDICRLVTTATTPKPNFAHSSTKYQQIITICGNCTECPTSINNIYAYLKQLLIDMEISLIVIIRDINHRQITLARIPTRLLRAGDKELDIDCPVCIDPYRAGDIIRLLPCRHIFHKTCVDPWLLEHRTCPMCKSDILKAFGYYISIGRSISNNTHRESIHQSSRDGDILSDDIHSLTGSEPAFTYSRYSEGQNQSNTTTLPQHQLVQVMHCSNINTFSITPLTIHRTSSLVKNVNANSEQEKNATHRISWQIRRPSSTAPHIVNTSHLRSRSLSHVVPPIESQKPKTIVNSNTFGSGLTSLRFSSIVKSSITPTNRDTSSSMLMTLSDPTSSTFTVPPNRKNPSLQQKLKPKRVNSQEIERSPQQPGCLTSVESL